MSILAYSLQSMLVGVFFMISLQQVLGSSMQVEYFNRLNLSQQTRKLAGLVQLIGTIGLVIGFWVPVFVICSSVWIGLTMLVACYTHMRINQPLGMAFPAFGLAVIAFTLTYLNVYTL